MAVMKVSMCARCERYIEISRIPCSSLDMDQLRRGEVTIGDAICERVLGRKFLDA
ncbi:hypothetical protein [Sphingomonas limnosediminicola]|uniref:hypothetical protein n=1 Tax=Sphingomonas limnosediminicola TaxID=940133 RepID=UPI0031D2FD36